MLLGLMLTHIILTIICPIAELTWVHLKVDRSLFLIVTQVNSALDPMVCATPIL